MRRPLSRLAGGLSPELVLASHQIAERSAADRANYAMRALALPSQIEYRQEAAEYQRYLREKPVQIKYEARKALAPDGQMRWKYVNPHDPTDVHWGDVATAPSQEYGKEYDKQDVLRNVEYKTGTRDIKSWGTIAERPGVAGFQRMTNVKRYIKEQIAVSATEEKQDWLGRRVKTINPAKAMIATQKAINDLKANGYITGDEPWIREPAKEIQALVKSGKELTQDVLSRIFGTSAQLGKKPTISPAPPISTEPVSKLKEEYRSQGGIYDGDFEGIEMWRFPDGSYRLLE